MTNDLVLTLENFQSISRGELVFSQGLNFIIGQSNSGKSATFRALKACLANPRGSQRFIKKGTKVATVNVTFNGNNISWIRTPEESKYIINNEEYIKTGNSNAFNLVNNLGFVKDSNDTIMNIEEELQLPFPFGTTGSELFKLFENVFCVSDSATILKSAKDQEDKVKFDLSAKETEYSRNQKKLEELEKFRTEVDFSKLEAYKNLLSSRKSRLDDLSEGYDVILKASNMDKVDMAVSGVTFENKIIRYEELRSLKRVSERLKKLHALGKDIKTKTIPTQVNLPLYSELIKIRETIEKIQEVSNISAPVKNFTSLLDDYKDKVSYLREIKEIAKNIKLAKGRLDEVQPRIAMLETKLKEYKVCPLCHHAL